VEEEVHGRIPGNCWEGEAAETPRMVTCIQKWWDLYYTQEQTAELRFLFSARFGKPLCMAQVFEYLGEGIKIRPNGSNGSNIMGNMSKHVSFKQHVQPNLSYSLIFQKASLPKTSMSPCLRSCLVVCFLLRAYVAFPSLL
jgi:hypothetical protein